MNFFNEKLNYDFQIETLKNKTKDQIIQLISTLQKYDLHHTLFQSFINFSIYQLLKDHSIFHPKEGRGNPNGCKECTLEIYNIFHYDKKSEWDQSISNWVSIRKKRGNFISLINSFIEKTDQFQLLIYFDSTSDDLDQCLKWINIILQKNEKLVQGKLKLISNMIGGLDN